MKILRRKFLRCRCRQAAVSATILLLLYMTLSSLSVSIRDQPIRYVETDYVVDKDVVFAEVKDTRQSDTTTVRPKVVVDTHGCQEWFNLTFRDNLKVIANYPKGIAPLYFHKMDNNRTMPKNIVTSFPVIVTAANSGFYTVSQGLLKSIYQILLPKYKDLKVIYYDMGLAVDQHEELVNKCSICEVRKFPFNDYPNHVQRLKSYTWKPIIVRTVLMEYGWVWWMDSSVRFRVNDLDFALDYSKKHSFLFFTYAVVFAVAQHTDVQTMKYLNEDPCKFRHFGEIEATFVLFHFDDVTKSLVDAWTACALNEMCMCPPGTSGKLGCNVSNKRDGRCHRFDQAVLSILLRRLYHDQNDYPLVSEPFHIHDIRRGQGTTFLKTLP